MLAQPFNTEVGAGTLNPATFLRVLGPEPWRAAYVEPSVRPDDSRYGDNPNRMQTHTQFQVVLKPDPGDPQELYLGSLQALGISTERHDVRFVEDNWESPALGAWGLGWEVWLDGLEITQFTYFQQAGGLRLDPTAVEITYGLERILMAVQGATHFKDIAATDDVSYGEVVAQSELEMSAYYLDEADVEATRQLFAIYEAEAERLVERRLPVPAHVFVLKCSHAFNILDARGAVGATERARAFSRMRKLAHDVAVLWTERRGELGHPLGAVGPQAAEAPQLPDSGAGPSGPADLLVELGSEELPADDVTTAVTRLREALSSRLGSERLGHGAVEVSGTPRRIVALVRDVAPRQEDRTVSVRGPKADIAFDGTGTPTPAAVGFARKQAVEVDGLRRSPVGDVEYVFADRQEAGRSALDVLAAALPEVIGGLAFGRTMRWRAGTVAYPRPLRWVTALLGDSVVPFAYGDVASGRETRGLRGDDSMVVRLATARDHARVMAERQVVVDGGRRRHQVVAEAVRLAAEVGGTIDVEGEAPLLDEVANLVEQPVVLLGRFDKEFLELPADVLTMVMRKHQRYLPVRDADGELMAYFVAVANGQVDEDLVRAGNEAVLRARYADAAFFVRRDLARPLDEVRPALATLVFEERTGSMLERAERVERLAVWLADRLGLPSGERRVVERAAHLAKADLGTEMVVEMSGLAGRMGRVYALAQGESPAVAEAIFEHTLPRFADDRLPGTRAGAVVALADRADMLAALFAVGAHPTGSADPYALRRAALGLAQVVIDSHVAIDLVELFTAAAEAQRVDVPVTTVGDLVGFVGRRLEQRLVDDGHPLDLVRAVLVRAGRPDLAVISLHELEKLAATDRFRSVAAAQRRCERITRGIEPGAVDLALITEPAERRLWDAFDEVVIDLPPEPALGDVVDRYAQLVGPVDAFFDQVTVMADDDAVRRNRLALVASVAAFGRDLIAWDEVDER